MAIDRQAYGFSLWENYVDDFLIPFSLVGSKKKFFDFVFTKENFFQRQNHIKQIQNIIVNFNEEDKNIFQKLQADKLPDIFFIENENSKLGFDAVQIYKISKFIFLAKSIFDLFKTADFLFFDIPIQLLESVSSIVCFINEKGEISNQHPRIKPLENSLRELSFKKTSYKKDFINANRLDLVLDQTVYRDGREYFAYRNDVEKKDSDAFITDTKKHSNTGKSIYVETKQLAQLSGREIQLIEQIEEVKRKIINELSCVFVKHLYLISKILEKIIVADFYQVAVQVISEYDLHESKISEYFDIANAKYPMLENPVPFSFSSKSHNFVVTGSNGGGKTVFLKTICFLILQNQLFTFTSTAPLSSFPIFSGLYLDVFDNQNINNGLSGFTSRIANLTKISQSGDLSGSFIIIDEIERGTSNKDSLVLYMALRDFFNMNGSFFCVSTHNVYIKEQIIHDDSVDKFSFFYDNKTAAPDFKIQKGICFDTRAQTILEHANFAFDLKASIDKYYQKCSSIDKIEDIIKKRFEKEDDERKRIAELDRLARDLSEKQSELLKKEEELNLMSIKLLEKENAISNFTKSKTEGVKEHFNHPTRKHEEITKEIESCKSRLNEISQLDGEVFEVGDNVIIIRNGVIGKIKEIDQHGKKAKIACPSIIVTLNFYEFRKVRSLPKSSTEPIKYNPQTSLVLDLRGKYRQDAIDELEKQINSALVLSMPFFSIICGIGGGVVRQACMKTLDKFSSRLKYELSGDGGKIDVTLI